MHNEIESLAKQVIKLHKANNGFFNWNNAPEQIKSKQHEIRRLLVIRNKLAPGIYSNETSLRKESFKEKYWLWIALAGFIGGWFADIAKEELLQKSSKAQTIQEHKSAKKLHTSPNDTLSGSPTQLHHNHP